MARKIGDDEGRLSSDSEIYQKDDEYYKLTPEERYKKLDRKGKLQYFKDYKLGGVITFIVILCIVLIGVTGTVNFPKAIGENVVSLVKTGHLKKKTTVINIAVTGSAYTDKNIARMQKKIEDALHLPDNEQVIVQTGFDQSDYNSKTNLSTMLAGGEVDILIGNEKDFDYWAESGYFISPENNKEASFMNDVDKKYRHYSKLVTGEEIRGEKENDGKLYYCGVNLKDSKVFSSFRGVTDSNMIIGINVASGHKDYAAMAEKYILGSEYSGK